MRIGKLWPLLLLLSATAGICQTSIVKTGDTLVLSAKQLVSASNHLVPDAAAPGGEAVEDLGKAGYFLNGQFPQVPAGRYLVTFTVAVGKRTAPLAVGSVSANSNTLASAYASRRALAVDDFAQAEVYQGISVEITCPPNQKGTFAPYVLVSHDNLAVSFRVAAVELKALEITPVFISKVWPDKLLNRPNSDEIITVSVHNLTDAPQAGLKLHVELQGDLNTKLPVGDQEIALAPYESKDVPFTWNTGAREYGYDVGATLTNAQGGVVSQRSDCFAVTSSLYKMRIGFAVSPYFLDKTTVPDAVLRSRLAYGNYMEIYGWSPGAFAELYPRERFWSSGQISEWTYDRDVMKAWNAEMHRLGLSTFAYDISLYNGWAGQELMRKHPEWCAFTAQGRPDGNVDTAAWQFKENAYGADKPPTLTPFRGEMPNSGTVWPASDELMTYEAGEITKVDQDLGFNAVRWDGHPIIWTQEGSGGIIGTGLGKMIYNYDGRTIFQVAGNGDQQSLHNIQLIKTALRKADPNFEWGYNAGYDMTCETMPLTWKEVVKNAGIWVEGGFRSGDEGRADPSNTWAKYQQKLYLSSQFVLRGGGYPIHGALAADSVYMRRLLYALFLANGSHTSWHSDMTVATDMSRFATRYSQYLFDPNLHPWWGYPDIHVSGWVQWEERNAGTIPPLDTEAKVESARPIWFEKLLFHRELPDGTKDTVMHLINAPGKPYVDYLQMDPPPVQEKVGVTVRVPAGMKLKQAWCLSPDRIPNGQPLEATPAGDGWVKVTVPQLMVWDIIVFNWEKV
ncbi:MAG TPA: hypothetical protein VGM19_09250 [Armatimonadota bacterium]